MCEFSFCEKISSQRVRLVFGAAYYCKEHAREMTKRMMTYRWEELIRYEQRSQ